MKYLRSQNEASQKHIDIISADTQQGFIINLIREHDPFAQPKIYVQIKSSNKQRHLDEYFKMKSIMQDFLSFALARPILTLSMIGLASTNDANISESHTRDVSVEIYHTEFIDPFIARKKYHTVLFLFSHIAENFDITFRKWIEAEDVLREVIALYISVVDSPSMYLQIQFQLVIYALEAYHRRTTANQDNNLQEHNKKISDILRSCPPEYEDWLHEKLKYSYEPNLRHSLNELISKYELIFSRFVSDKKGDFVNKVVNTRNYLTHYDQDLRHKAITDMDILHEVTQKLIGLLQVCLLIQVASVEEVKVMYKIEG